MTMMEIRAKARRLKQRHDLRLIIIDYMQLMTSGKKVESRQLEVSEFSRQIKLLAKELEVPIIALSQLNRGPEQRGDKRPMMSDLRESGCLSADTRLMRADTNTEVTLGELMATGATDVPVWSLDDRLKLVPRTLTHAFPSGTKPVYELTLASGRRIKTTGNHKFLTHDGWMPLSELTPGSRIGSLRHVPPPLDIRARDADEIVLLAHLLGAGSLTDSRSVQYAAVERGNLDAVSHAVGRRFAVTPVPDRDAPDGVATVRVAAPGRFIRRPGSLRAWLDDAGLSGCGGADKHVPGWVFALPKAQVGTFLRHIWSTTGSVTYDGRRRVARIDYTAASRLLVDDLARLLLRFNVFTTIQRVRSRGRGDRWCLRVRGSENQLRFLDEVGLHGGRADAARQVAGCLRAARLGAELDTVPAGVWAQVRKVLSDTADDRGLPAASAALDVVEAPRAPMAEVAGVLDGADLDVVATNDVLWDAIASIEPIGEQPVYDATVLGTHNFVVEGIAAHNSLEQDADMVILLHRDDVYEKESTRPGEADLIVAKHRNGPTRDITVAFQGHYSRFVDMAH